MTNNMISNTSLQNHAKNGRQLLIMWRAALVLLLQVYSSKPTKTRCSAITEENLAEQAS